MAYFENKECSIEPECVGPDHRIIGYKVWYEGALVAVHRPGTDIAHEKAITSKAGFDACLRMMRGCPAVTINKRDA